jgi:hypothetical protein
LKRPTKIRATIRSIAPPHMLETDSAGAEVDTPAVGTVAAGVVEDVLELSVPSSKFAVDGFISEPTPFGACAGPLFKFESVSIPVWNGATPACGTVSTGMPGLCKPMLGVFERVGVGMLEFERVGVGMSKPPIGRPMCHPPFRGIEVLIGGRLRR